MHTDSFQPLDVSGGLEIVPTKDEEDDHDEEGGDDDIHIAVGCSH